MTDEEEHTPGIDVPDLQMAGFVDAQAGSVAGHEEGAKLGGGEGCEESLQLVGVQDGRQASGPPFGEGEVLNVPRPLQGDGVEELEGGSRSDGRLRRITV